MGARLKPLDGARPKPLEGARLKAEVLQDELLKGKMRAAEGISAFFDGPNPEIRKSEF